MGASSLVIAALVAEGLSHDELGARMGVARETVSRWARGVNAPSLEALQLAAAAAGRQLEVRLLSADPELVALVHDQLDLGPTNRLKALLADRWPACRDGLRAAAAVGELGVLIGPVAAALCGAAHRLDGQVDLLVDDPDREEASGRLLAADAYPDGVQRASATAAQDRRERWRLGQGTLTVRTRTTGVDDVAAVRRRALPAMLNADDVGVVHVGYVEDLLAIALASAWSEDHVYVPSLRAVLASGRYRTRAEPTGELELA